MICFSGRHPLVRSLFSFSFGSVRARRSPVVRWTGSGLYGQLQPKILSWATMTTSARRVVNRERVGSRHIRSIDICLGGRRFSSFTTLAGAKDELKDGGDDDDDDDGDGDDETEDDYNEADLDESDMDEEPAKPEAIYDNFSDIVTQKAKIYTPYKFVDRAVIDVKGGRGGNGCVSFQILTPGKRRPDGGNGGSGGNVYLVADKSISSMNFERMQFNAQEGKHGGSDGLTGKKGKDIFVRVPCGTVVSEGLPDGLQDYMSDEGYDLDEIISKAVDLDEDGMTLLVAEGGKGGFGNASAAGTSVKRARSMPKTNLPGQAGVSRQLQLELKIIADVGLVGFPNAGKSTLLSVLSNASPRIASFSFTTLHPNIGVVEYSDLFQLTIADIPGLIDGAHDNRGLGHDFLRHVERTKVLLYVLDGAGTDGREPHKDFKTLMKELELYDEELLKKPSVVFINKSDLTCNDESIRNIEVMARRRRIPVYTGSALAQDRLSDIAVALRKVIEKAIKAKQEKEGTESEQVKGGTDPLALPGRRARASRKKSI